MDFFENVKSAVGSAAQTVVKKSGEAVEYSKVKYSIFDIKNTIKNLYADIGETVYLSYKNQVECDDSIKNKCIEIDNLNNQLDELNDLESNFKAMVKCPKCSKLVKENCTYCPYCGEKLSHEVDAEFDDSKTVYYTQAHEPVDDEPGNAPMGE